MSLIRVFEMPLFVQPNYRFGEGMPMPFIEVDWFRDDAYPLNAVDVNERKANAANMEAFIRKKQYFRPTHGYLVLHPTHPMCINCDETLMLGRRTWTKAEAAE